MHWNNSNTFLKKADFQDAISLVLSYYYPQCAQHMGLHT